MGAQAAVGGYVPPTPYLSDGTGWIHSFCFSFFNSNSLTLKKLNSNSNALTFRKLNSNSCSLVLQKSNSNSNSSIIRERIQIQNQIQFNPTYNSGLASMFASLSACNPTLFEKISQRWRSVGNTVFDLTGMKFKPLTSSFSDHALPLD